MAGKFRYLLYISQDEQHGRIGDNEKDQNRAEVEEGNCSRAVEGQFEG